MSLDKVATHPLQTKAWKEFREAWGNEILETKYGILTLHNIPFTGKKIGMFIRGPQPTAKMLADLAEIGKQQNLIFIKFEPNIGVIARNEMTKQSNSKDRHASLAMTQKLLKKAGSVPGKTLFTPTSFIIDLTKSEEELLISFKGKTRYNIRYSERQGVEVTEETSDKAFAEYIKLMRETVERQRFYAHSEKYHRLMWEYLHKAGIAHLLIAKHKNKILTTWILFKWRDTLYYPYGASTSSDQNLQSNSAMMWAAIKFGKKLKCKRFDLWGREEGKGFTKFKEGFSPEVFEFLGTWDLVINKNYYYLYLVLEKIRWFVLRTKSLWVKPRF